MSLINKECYICLKPCQTKSPCSCQANVHKKCLQKWNTFQDKSSCSICKDKIQYKKKRYKLFCCW